MQEKFNKLITKLNLDINEYLEGGLLKINVDNINNKWTFNLKFNDILPIEKYNNLLTSLKETFKDININLVVNYDNIDIKKLKEYFNYILDNIIKNNASFNTFKDREINIIKNNIIIEVYNKV